MMQFSDYKFMSIGSNCAGMLFLGKDRLKGPVDNVVILDAYAIKYLIDDIYYSYITDTNNYKLVKPSYGKARPQDPDNWYEYKYVRILHNDPSTDKYKKELLARLELFNSFLKNVKKTVNHYFVFTLNEYMCNTKTHTLQNKTFYYILNYLKSVNLLSKVIFVMMHAPGIPHGGYADCWLQDIDKFKNQYGLTVIELFSDKIIDSDKLQVDFKNKFMQLKMNGEL